MDNLTDQDLPVEPSHKPDEDSALTAAEGSALPPIRILIVDDHPNTATMLARVLSRFDTPVEVLTASSGEEALVKIGGQAGPDRSPRREKTPLTPVDILITDFMMPGLNGLELIERLKGETRPAHIILITAYDTPGLAITARRLNVQEYLVKPVQPDKIRSIVARLIEELRPQKSAALAPVKYPYKILIADDYPDNLRLLSTRLHSEGYTFIPAWDGEEALQKLHSEQPDLLLLDINMPKKDGFQVLAEMRTDPELAHIPVIIITAARIGPKDVREGLILGADDYIIKPFDWRELAARIATKLRVKHAEDQLRRRAQELGLLPQLGQEITARLPVFLAATPAGAVQPISELAHIVVNRTAESLRVAYARLDIFQPDGQVYCCERRLDAPRAQEFEITYQQALETGLLAAVCDTRQGLVASDVRQEPRWHGLPVTASPSAPNVFSAVAVPLLGHQDVIGVLTLAHQSAAYFTAEHQDLAQAIASQAAIAIENARLFKDERSAAQKRVQELNALNQIAQEMNRCTHTRQLLESLPRLVQEKLGYPVAALWQASQGGECSLVSISHYAPGVMEPSDKQPGSVPEDFLVALPHHILDTGGAQFAEAGESSMLAVPLPLTLSGLTSDRGQVSNGTASVSTASRQPADKGGIVIVGVFSPHPAAFDASDLALLQALATQVAAALERLSLFESVEQEQHRLLAVLRSAADAILVVERRSARQWVLALANPAGENLLAGLPSNGDETDHDTIMNQPIPDGKGYDNLISLLEQAWQTSGELGGSLADGMSGRARRGEIAWPDGRIFSGSVTPVQDTAQLVVLHDVTAFRALADLKNEYIATASHDLKNPIQAVLGYNDLLSKAGPLTSMQEDFSRRIRSAAQQMRELVLNLLEISRLESGQPLRVEDIDLHPLLEETAQELASQAQAHSQRLAVELQPGVDPHISGDRTLLQQLVRNLLSNAIKYTPNGGSITLSTQLEPAQTGEPCQYVRLDFSDTGIGIAPEDLPHLFGKFFRVQSDATRDIEGTGLGLAIVKSIVESHTGSISVGSVLEQGTTFSVRLPVYD